jgi:diaminopimelate decarboxylase
VNPDVDAQTHPYISTGLKENKFGIAIEDARAVYRSANDMTHLDIIGVDCHIGSQLTSVAPFVDALKRVLALIDELKADGTVIKHLDIGGGLGIHYRDETPPTPAEYAAELKPLLADRDLEILLEPGRAIAGNAGILLTKVEFIKPTEAKQFAIVDAAMNDLLRPALYQSWQAIVPVEAESKAPAAVYDIVGPICETGDFLGKDRELEIEQGDLLAIRSAGAYGFTMSSNYNSRPRAAEVMVDGDAVHLVRERETVQDLFSGEHVLAS